MTLVDFQREITGDVCFTVPIFKWGKPATPARQTFECVQLWYRPQGGCPHPRGVGSRVVHTGICGQPVGKIRTGVWRSSPNLYLAHSAGECVMSITGLLDQ